MTENRYVIGVDFGTDSVRSIVVDADTGREVSSHISVYRRWSKGMYCDPAKNQFRQHPLDYIEGLEESIKESVKTAGKNVAERIVGIGIDTTGSTPAPVDRDGTVLALKEEFKDDPDAMFILWKDHTSIKEADDINRVSWNWGGIDFTKYVGGIYSSEWFWAKILHVLRNNPNVGKSAFSWVEHADWVPALLTGNLDPASMKRSRCAAGHKAMWNEEWGGLPSEEFLVKVDPLLKGLRERLYAKTYTSDVSAGKLTEEWAERLNVPAGIDVAVGAFDAHMGAVGSEIKKGTLVKIIGTSCCDMAVADYKTIGKRLIKGICGQVDGSIIPGMVGLEAGQSAFGDIYAWFKNVVVWPVERLKKFGEIDEQEYEKIESKILAMLSEEAERLDDESGWPVSLDWHNGRRSPFANQKLKGALLGLTLGTDAVRIYRSLVEATAFGAKAILDRFKEEEVDFHDTVASGGIPKKSPYVMQVLSDVLGIPVKVTRAEQTGALGASMFASVAAGVYKRVEDAQKAMGGGFETTYYPREEKINYYRKLYDKYRDFATSLEELLEK